MHTVLKLEVAVILAVNFFSTQQVKLVTSSKWNILEQWTIKFNSELSSSTVNYQVQQRTIKFHSELSGSTVNYQVQQWTIRFNSELSSSTANYQVQQWTIKFDSELSSSTYTQVLIGSWIVPLVPFAVRLVYVHQVAAEGSQQTSTCFQWDLTS